jgi:hypothetical protein
MKKKVLLLLSFVAYSATAQQTETLIDFNNYISATNNDLVNKFTQTYKSFEIAENTDTSGYWLTTPLSGYATDPLRTCNKFRLDAGDLLDVSVDFKKVEYPSSFGNNSISIGIYITDDSGETFLSNSIMYTRDISISGLEKTDDYMQNSFAMLDNNWYRLNFKINRGVNNTFTTTAYLYDLGSNGLDNPYLKRKITGTGKNYDFKSKTGYKVHIAGGLWGNVKYIDNLKIVGVNLGNSCSNLSVEEIEIDTKIKVFPTVTSNYIYINHIDNQSLEIELYDSLGQKIARKKEDNKINMEGLSVGIYYLTIRVENKIITKKIIKN